jgi:hypothetical protein
MYNKVPQFRYSRGSFIPIGYRILKGHEITQRFTDFILPYPLTARHYPYMVDGWHNKLVSDLNREEQVIIIRKIDNTERSETDLKKANWQ